MAGNFEFACGRRRIHPSPAAFAANSAGGEPPGVNKAEVAVELGAVCR